MELATKLSKKVIDVIILCNDPTSQHHSKRSTIKRWGDKERANIELFHSRLELQQLLLADNNIPAQNLTKINLLPKKIKKLEK